MTFIDWVSESVERAREDGLSSVSESGYELYLGSLRRAGHIYNYGTPIFDRDWDVLIILDACRADLMAEVNDEYDFLVNPGTLRSVASTSTEWMDKNFTNRFADELRDTIYVTSNPFSDEHTDQNKFYELDEVWRYAWDEDAGTVRPRPITDRAIRHNRNHPSKRLIVHYMQPHYPFIEGKTSQGIDIDSFGEEETPSVWDLLRQGKVDEKKVWREYRDNLRLVLNDLGILLNNINAEHVVISADHGNAIGEYGVYGHPGYVPLPVLKRVPWYETSATDEQTHEPVEWNTNSDQSDVEQRLKNLGYI